jgi:hypothetical protein
MRGEESCLAKIPLFVIAQSYALSRALVTKPGLTQRTTYCVLFQTRAVGLLPLVTSTDGLCLAQRQVFQFCLHRVVGPQASTLYFSRVFCPPTELPWFLF